MKAMCFGSGLQHDSAAQTGYFVLQQAPTGYKAGQPRLL